MTPGSFIEVPLVRGFEAIYPFWIKWNRLAHFCGGYARYCASPLLNPVEPGDFDIFPKSMEDFDTIKADILKMGIQIGFESSVAITYQKPLHGPFKDCPQIQLIKPVNQGAIVNNGSLEEILSNFDFTVIRTAIISPYTCLVDEDFINDEMSMKLNVKNIHCPISSTLRFMKYAKKGYKANAADVLRLFTDWDAREEEYRNNLIEGIPKLMAGGESELDEDEKDQLAKLIYID